MNTTTYFFLACSGLLSVAGCNGSDGPNTGGTNTGGAGANQAPVISALSADREGMLMGSGHATLTLEATDPDGDTLTFAWTVTDGTLDKSDGPGPVVLSAPGQRGTVTVKVTVTDGRGGSADKTLDMGVLGFVQVPQIPFKMTFNAVSFSSADDGVAVGGAETTTGNVPYIMHYKAGTWTDETKGASGHLTATKAFAPDDIWATGGGGLGFHYDGTTWKQFTVPGGCVHGMDAIDPDDIWVTPAEGQAYMRRYTGGALNAWTQYPAPGSSGMNGVSMVSEDDGWAVGAAGRVIRFDGTEWTKQSVSVSALLKGVHMLSATEGFIVGGSGKVLRWDGTAWSEQTTDAGTTALTAVYAVASDEVWAVGAKGTILHYDGTAWTTVPSHTKELLNAVTFVSPTSGWIVGENGTILHLE